MPDESTATVYERTLREILEGLPGEAALLGPDGTVRLVNTHWALLQVPGAFAGEGFLPGVDYVRQCVATNGTASAECERLARGVRRVLSDRVGQFAMGYTRSGTLERWFHLIVVAVPFEEYGALVFHQDLTGLSGVVRHLVRESELWSAVADAVPDPLYLKDRESRFIRINHAQARILGVASPTDAVGKTEYDFYPAELAREVEEDEQRVLTTGEPLVAKALRQVTADRGACWFVTTKVPWRDATGRIVGILGTSREITELKMAEAELARFSAIVASSRDAIISQTLDGRITSWNPAAEHIYGYEAAEIVGRSIATLVPADRLGELDGILARVRRGESLSGFETERVTRDGRRIHVSLTYSPIHDVSGRLVGSSIIARDVTQRHLMERALLREKERAVTTLSSISDAVVTVDPEGRVEYLNPVAEQLTGWALAQAQGERLDAVVRLISEDTRDPISDLAKAGIDGRASLEQLRPVLLSRTGEEHGVDVSVTRLEGHDDAAPGCVLAMRDVTKARVRERQLSYRATHDPLTGLVNRYEFERRLQRVLLTAPDETTTHSVIFLDLDEFKLVNDTCGHLAGDQLLRELGAALQSTMRKRDTLARLGGDEFAALLEHCPPDHGKRVAEELLRTVREFRFMWSGKAFPLGASAGLVVVDARAQSLMSVLQKADAACYAAKERGRNRLHVFREDEAEQRRRHSEMNAATSITRALEDDRFRLYCQPIIPMGPGGADVRRYEVLLRMVDERGAIVLPQLFIPGAERYHLMPAIDRWVVQQVITFLRGWEEREVAPIIAVNLSGQSLNDGDIVEFAEAQLRLQGVPANQMCFEITETTAIANLKRASDLLTALRSFGCAVALDDFGSGMCSFGYLKNFPLDFVKIAGSFVRAMNEDSVSRAVVEAVHRVGTSLGLQTVAEEVESRSLFAALRWIGVGYAQGYALGEPFPLEQLRTPSPVA